MTKNKIKKSLSLIAVSAATALSLVGMSITPSTFVSAGQQLGQTDFENHIYHFTYLEEKLKKQIIEALDLLH